MMINEPYGFTKSDRRVGDLHYAVRNISDEAFDCVLTVARSFAVDDTNPGTRLVRQTRCVIYGDGSAALRLFWEFDGVPFISNVYVRNVRGRWMSDKCGVVAPAWSARLEETYQRKVHEVSVAAYAEMN